MPFGVLVQVQSRAPIQNILLNFTARATHAQKPFTFLILISSDTDIVPAVRVAKDEGARIAYISYISFDKMIIRSFLFFL